MTREDGKARRMIPVDALAHVGFSYDVAPCMLQPKQKAVSSRPYLNSCDSSEKNKFDMEYLTLSRECLSSNIIHRDGTKNLPSSMVGAVSDNGVEDDSLDVLYEFHPRPSFESLGKTLYRSQNRNETRFLFADRVNQDSCDLKDTPVTEIHGENSNTFSSVADDNRDGDDNDNEKSLAQKANCNKINVEDNGDAIEPDRMNIQGNHLDDSFPDPELKSFIELELPTDFKFLKTGKTSKNTEPKDSLNLMPKYVPWRDLLAGISSPSLRLHTEIVEFTRLLRPSAHEEALRRQAFNRLNDIVAEIWPDASLKIFGSFATDLYLPTSDIDAVVLNSGLENPVDGLKALAKSLSRKKSGRNIVVLSRARVPIIKYDDVETGYKFDVSFDVPNGPQAAAYVCQLMASLPPMRPLVMILKVFLQQRELNEVFSGGIGSYALLVMVASFLQTHPSRMLLSEAKFTKGTKNSKYSLSDDIRSVEATNSNRRPHGSEENGFLETNLGLLLIDFLRLYGRLLNYNSVGISCRDGGKFFQKRSRGFFRDEKPYLMAVEDPNDPTNDLGKNCFNINRARTAFDWAYSRLTSPSNSGESLLERIIRLDSALFLRNGTSAVDVGIPPAKVQFVGGIESLPKRNKNPQDVNYIEDEHGPKPKAKKAKIKTFEKRRRLQKKKQSRKLSGGN